MYETLILIDADSGINADAVSSAVASWCLSGSSGAPVLETQPASVEIKWPSFSLIVAFSDDSHVVEESTEIADQFAAGHPSHGRIRECASRIEISGDSDPDMNYFNDYCLLVEALESLGKVYTFDPGSGEFQNL